MQQNFVVKEFKHWSTSTPSRQCNTTLLYATLQYVNTLSVSLWVTSEPHGVMPHAWYLVLAHFVDVLSRFKVTLFRLTAVWRNWRFSPPNFRAGERKLKVGFKPWPHAKVVCKFRGDQLRDG